MCELKEHIEALNKKLGSEVSDQEVDALKCTLKRVFKNFGIELSEKILLSTRIGFEQHQTNVNLVVREESESDSDRATQFIMEISRSDGTVLFIDQCTHEDNQSCPNHLQDYPLVVDDIEFTLVRGRLYASGNEVTIRYPKDNVNTFWTSGHTPLARNKVEYDENQMYDKEQLVYLGRTEQSNLILDGISISPNSLKFVLCRHAWGYNITLAYYVHSCNTIFCGTTFNQDYPEPRAIEISGEKLIMHLVKDEPTLKRVYQTKQSFETNANLSQLYGHAKSRIFFSLKTMAKRMPLYYSVKSLTREQRNCIDELEHHLCDTPVTDDKWLQNITSQYNICPYSGDILYNMACAHAVRDKHDKALHYLEQSMKYGRASFRHMSTDKDLDSLRSNSKFIELMKDYENSVRV